MSESAEQLCQMNVQNKGRTDLVDNLGFESVLGSSWLTLLSAFRVISAEFNRITDKFTNVAQHVGHSGRLGTNVVIDR